jgi:hypothetical protein
VAWPIGFGLMVSLDGPSRQRWAVFARRLAARKRDLNNQPGQPSAPVHGTRAAAFLKYLLLQLPKRH